MRRFPFFLPVLALFLSGCMTQGALTVGPVTFTNVVSVPAATNNVILTNTIITVGKHTNNALVTNYLVLSNSNFTISGYLTVTDVQNEDTVQPTFRVSGIIGSNLAALLTSVSVTVTNDGFVTNAVISGTSWSAVVRQQPQTYLSVLLQANFGGYGGWASLLNVYVTNIPEISCLTIPAGLVTNSSYLLLSGTASVTTNSLITNVTAYTIDEYGNTNVFGCGFGGIPGWDSTVSTVNWSKLLPISFGSNTIWVTATSSDGLTSSIAPFNVIRSLISVDGNYDPLWNSAPLIAATTNPGYNGYQLGQLRVTNDAQNLYFWVGASNVPNLGNAGARISIAIRTNGPGGVTNDAWGGLFTFPTNDPAQYQLQFRASGTSNVNGFALYSAFSNAWTDVLYSWNSGSVMGSEFAVNLAGGGFEISLPWALLDIASGSSLSFIVVLSGADGTTGNEQAWDVLPESVTFSFVTNYYTNVSGSDTNVTGIVTTNYSGNPVAQNENDFGQALTVWSAPYVLQ
jgi:hypothetical protein